MMNRLRFQAPALLLISLALTLHAQPPTATQCGQYVEAYKSGAPAYSSYLETTEQTAKTRDTEEHNTRYTAALHTSAPAANALWLNNWCTKNPLRTFSEASYHLLDELTGQSPSNDAAPAPPPQVIIVSPQHSAPPSSCRVGDNGTCSGCSVTCGNGSIAKCKQGSEFADHKSCAFQSRCDCDFSKNGPPPPADTSSGYSSCRVGNNGTCSGCSISCNNGQTAKCKQGSEFADHSSCAFQSKCECK